MPRKPIIAVVGSGEGTDPAISNARQLGRLIAENDWVLITGGRDAGVMKAANEGAKEIEESLTIGILPDPHADASPAVDVAVVTDMGQARNNIIVLSADVVVACGVEGAGTASEVSLAIKNGKPVILLSANDEAKRFFKKLCKEGIYFADSSQEAILLANKILQYGVADRRRKHDR